MRVKRNDSIGSMAMSQTLVCANYANGNHIDLGFESISDNEYKCITCGQSMIILQEPKLVLSDKGRLEMVVETVKL